jgi:CRP-like cAMP-binding protein
MNKLDKIEFFSQRDIFWGAPKDLLEHIADQAQYRLVKRFDFVYMPDQKADYLYFLVGGRVKTGTFSGEGREIIKEILSEGELFGDLALAGEETRSEFAQALCQDVALLSVSVADFKKCLEKCQTLLFACMQHITRRLQRTEERIASLVAKDARSRIIDFIQEYAHRDGRRVGMETLVKHQLTQQDIASITGTSRQTVTTVFNELKRHNIIHFRRNKILIRDVSKLSRWNLVA